MTSTSLRALGVTFLRLGLTSFGGPAAHIALFRDEFVRRRGWLDDAAFLDLVGAANLIPGPTSTEVAMHLGHRRAGWPGLVVAGTAFILPAALIVGGLAAVYVAAGARPEIEAVLGGVAPVVLAVIAHAGCSLGRAAIRGPTTAAILVAAAIASLVGMSELLLLLGFGILAVVLQRGARLAAGWRARAAAAAAWPLAAGDLAARLVLPGEGTGTLALVAGAVLAVGSVGPSVTAIFGEFLKIGALLFGSGYVLVAFLEAELVEGLAWISQADLLDAIAVGQATPGPYYTTATFVGYLLGGPLSAMAATVGIFLPGFVAVVVSIPFLGRVQGSGSGRAFLDGVNAAAVGLLAVVVVRLAVPALLEPLAILVAIAAFLLLVRGVGTGWLVAAGAGLGLVRLAADI